MFPGWRFCLALGGETNFKIPGWHLQWHSVTSELGWILNIGTYKLLPARNTALCEEGFTGQSLPLTPWTSTLSISRGSEVWLKFWKAEPKSGPHIRWGCLWLEGRTAPARCPQAGAPAGGKSALERSVINASHSALLSAWQGLRMHNRPGADYLQVQLGRVKNSISGAQAGRPLSHRRLLPVNEQEMASHFPGIAGRGLCCVYSLPRGSTSAPRAWRQGPGVRTEHSPSLRPATHAPFST